jgi:hypothetical protein
VASWVDPPSLRRIRGNPKQVLGARSPSRSHCPVSKGDAVQVAEQARHARGADTVAIYAVARVRLLPEVDCLIEIHRKIGRKSQVLEGGAVRPRVKAVWNKLRAAARSPFLCAARPCAIKSSTIAATLMIISR